MKPKFRQMLMGRARWLSAHGVSPDQITTSGLVAGAVGGLAFWQARKSRTWFAAVPVMALLRISANALDGLVAQLQGSGRPAGELFNETSDRISDLLFFSGAATVDGASRGWAFGALAASELASFVGVASKAAGASRRYDGPMGKPDRMFVLGAASLAAIPSRRPERVMDAAFKVIAVGAGVTAANRFCRAFSDLGTTSRNSTVR